MLIEDELFFTQYPFHTHKLILHRASMKNYAHALEAASYTIEYIESIHYPGLKSIFENLANSGVTVVHYTDPTDYLLERRIRRYATVTKLNLCEHSSPNFLCDKAYLNEYFNVRKKYFLTEFYIAQRKRLDILIEGGNPTGGKWTFDTENRKKLPKSIALPTPVTLRANLFVREAIGYVAKHFPANPGTADTFNYPVTREEALQNLDDFIESRFTNYGVYQDAIDADQSFLFHSLLTPALNIGLIEPETIVEAVLEKKDIIPINSLEGFLRQLIGWREFIRAVYLREGTTQRTANHFNFERTLPDAFWKGTTGIVPVDNVIQKTIRHAYSNHIERLMIMGNFLLLCRISPDEVYKWFMSFYIDAYDWVMVPNVYGMSQYADGGLMSTKPYISGSNYVRKMSRFEKGEWCDVWDALFWTFIKDHQQEFSMNPRMNMMLVQLNKMDAGKLKRMEMAKEGFLSELMG